MINLNLEPKCAHTNRDREPDPDAWGTFTAALQNAMTNIGKEHFEVQRWDSKPVWRERVYCYELYHNLRDHLPRDFPYILHGEIDKRGHESLLQYGNGTCPNPDFVIHKPGKWGGLVVIEVKSINWDNAIIQADVNKLQCFVSQFGYDHGVMILIGSGETPEVKLYNNVELWLHPAPQSTPSRCICSNTFRNLGGQTKCVEEY